MDEVSKHNFAHPDEGNCAGEGPPRSYLLLLHSFSLYLANMTTLFAMALELPQPSSLLISLLRPAGFHPLVQRLCRRCLWSSVLLLLGSVCRCMPMLPDHGVYFCFGVRVLAAHKIATQGDLRAIGGAHPQTSCCWAGEEPIVRWLERT